MKWSQLFVIVDIILYIKKIKMKYSDVNLTKWSLPCARKMLKSQPVKSLTRLGRKCVCGIYSFIFHIPQ